jgi:GDSL-like Lipase/Acylhydrolase family
VGRCGKWLLRGVRTAASLSAAALLPACLLATGLVFGLAGAIAGTAETAAGASQAPAQVEYYLDLGGSASVGFQPTAARPNGQPTDDGYANDLLTLEQARWHDLQLVQFGCPGETTGTFMNGGDPCRPAGQTQLSQAVTFLHMHPDTVLVTVDLGFNDIERCMAFHIVDETCLTQRLDLINQQLPPILAALRAAAAPSVRFVGVGHYDPYLGAYLHGGSAVAFSEDSVAAMERLDGTLHAIYSGAGIPVADVGRAFGITQNEPTDLAGVGNVPRNVARTCALTWMCTSASQHARQHPDDAGYQVIAQAIAAAVPD